MDKIKTAFNNFIAQFVKTFEANKTKPSYWLQIIGSILIIGLAIGSAFFGLKIDRSDVLMTFTVIGSVLAFVGTVTDNSILENVGNGIKDDSDSLTNSEQDVLNKLVEAQKAIENAKKPAEKAQLALSAANEAQSVADSLASELSKEAVSDASVNPQVVTQAVTSESASVAEPASAISEAPVSEATSEVSSEAPVSEVPSSEA
ncbi:hypothetical protein 8014-B2_0042 [Lactobacillus phage ATCC 8014-B2]|uniref:Holin n=1 Tax=Lactobacillus phage ATCC 8014-B2 TaxID=1225795 RepID=K4ID52_9CAUD|nr:hypothetical protein HOQ89_gp104 [Lactobacillus phage ATCC 8014-B2]AFU63109.1 hypothetical protein 8014-B2_0042 [Lactobacillus phage ATCC 8014-B2]